MKKELTTAHLKEIEDQLSCPTGTKGIEIATSMNLTNITMTKASIDALNISNNDVILEIGHGNCGHLEYVLNKASNIYYIGLEVSKTMQQEALLQLNKQQDSKNISFELYDGEKLPFENNSIDKIFTVNTLYFWKKPTAFLAEISRVLKKEGICIITFAEKEFMQTLPFVNTKFNLYTNDDINSLLKKNTLKIVNTIHKSESIESKIGDYVNRKYTLIILKQ
ncbi:class I SAM-dependent methyltransferase [Tenacibaculum sp. Bg11-29]|uniref:class I SAM-dependent methyltransferase n=1 Tax=Tenacibaculum sp. Bg11-29 TaxID=2058306 RepID=UPI000C348F84|nr:class I SAM-dependent methyltransferase [Tenacibaculum sp. Bg11-29]PKH49773.1 class I SAM-dependent methyltransferase [Tenacibaculum sp. Bg11-29]